MEYKNDEKYLKQVLRRIIKKPVLELILNEKYLDPLKQHCKKKYNDVYNHIGLRKMKNKDYQYAYYESLHEISYVDQLLKFTTILYEKYIYEYEIEIAIYKYLRRFEKKLIEKKY